MALEEKVAEKDSRAATKETGSGTGEEPKSSPANEATKVEKPKNLKPAGTSKVTGPKTPNSQKREKSPVLSHLAKIVKPSSPKRSSLKPLPPKTPTTVPSLQSLKKAFPSRHDNPTIKPLPKSSRPRLPLPLLGLPSHTVQRKRPTSFNTRRKEVQKKRATTAVRQADRQLVFNDLDRLIRDIKKPTFHVKSITVIGWFFLRTLWQISTEKAGRDVALNANRRLHQTNLSRIIISFIVLILL